MLTLKKIISKTSISLLLILSLITVGCTPASSPKEDAGDVNVQNPLIRIGFSQIGAESDWRRANSESIQTTLTKENGFQLYFEDARQKQANQAMAIRRFIQQGVDYIILAPMTEDGWENVLAEAKKADIPVILVDRQIQVTDKSLYKCHIGSDFRLESDKMMSWLEQYLRQNKINAKMLHIAHLQGSLGATAQIGRTEGLESAAKRNHWKIEAREDADFTQAKGREVMSRILIEHPKINIVYSENDEMSLGAIEAIEAAGRTAGSDIKNGEIMVLSFDGVSDNAMQTLIDGKITCIGECYPKHGSYVRSAINMLEAKEIPDRELYVSESLYCADSSITQVSVDDKTYPVSIITQQWLDNRN